MRASLPAKAQPPSNELHGLAPEYIMPQRGVQIWGNSARPRIPPPPETSNRSGIRRAGPTRSVARYLPRLAAEPPVLAVPREPVSVEQAGRNEGSRFLRVTGRATARIGHPDDPVTPILRVRRESLGKGCASSALRTRYNCSSDSNRPLRGRGFIQRREARLIPQLQCSVVFKEGYCPARVSSVFCDSATT